MRTVVRTCAEGVFLFLIPFSVLDAQVGSCKGKLEVVSVEQQVSPSRIYSYEIFVRNKTFDPVRHWEVTFSRMPADLRLYSAHETNFPAVQGSQSAHLRFGYGTVGVDYKKFTIGYDSSGANIVLTNCR